MLQNPEATPLVAMTPRELEVLQLIASGLSNAETARRLHVSIHAVKFHLAEIYKRLGVTNRTEAAVTYLRLVNGSLDAERTGRLSGPPLLRSRPLAVQVDRDAWPLDCGRAGRSSRWCGSVTKGVTYRQSVLWSSTTRLLVTQRGFPEGRLLIQPPGARPGQATSQTRTA